MQVNSHEVVSASLRRWRRLILCALCLPSFAVCPHIMAQQQSSKPIFHPIDPQRIRKWDPLQEFMTDRDGPAGLLAYPAHIGENDLNYVENFLVLRSLGPGKLPGPATVLKYEGDYDGTLFYPGIAPNGRYVAFNVGEYEGKGSSYRLLLWDRQSRKLLRGPNEILHAWEHHWSPDSTKIAYLRGGDAAGQPLPGMESTAGSYIQLCVFDLRTGKTSGIVKSNDAAFMAWTPQGKLLYTAPSRHRECLSIYETPASGGPAREILPGGRAPIPSPDGKWIAFMGDPTPLPASRPGRKRRQNSVPRFGLFLFERSSGRRLPVRAGNEHVGAMWPPDSKHLIVTEETYGHLGKDQGQGKATVSLLDVRTLRQRRIAALKATDIVFQPRGDFETLFRPMSVSSDGTWACFRGLEIIKSIRSSYQTRYSLQAVNLKTGKTLLLAQTANFAGSSLEPDWRFDPIRTTHH